MGMAIDGEGRAATTAAVATPVATSPPAVPTTPLPSSASPATAEDVVGTHGESEEKARRERSNSEETALILTSMMSMSKFAAPGANKAHDSDEDGHSDMGEDMSGDEDEEYHGNGKGKRRVQHVHFGGPTGSKLDFTDDAGFNHRFRNESNRVKSLVTKHISIDELREHFDRPIIDVAKDFGICITLMKKICRRNGIKRWPHRQIRSLSKSIASMEAAMLSSQGPEREKYRDQILSLKLKRDSVIADPNKENSMTRPKTPTKDTSSRPHSHVHSAPKLSPRSGSPTTTPSSQAAKENSKGGRWTSEEHAAFLHGIRLYGKDWRRVAQVVRTRSAVQTRTHAQKYLLKFAGRFPFDADGLEIKQDPESHVTPQGQSENQNGSMDRGDDEMIGVDTRKNEKETDGGDTASLSSSSLEDDTSSLPRGHSPPMTALLPSSASLSVDTATAKTSALETMAIILNSPQFGGSFKQRAPPAIQTHLPTSSGDANVDHDVAMASPRGTATGEMPTNLPVLPSFVIQPAAWPPTQPTTKTDSVAPSDAP